MPLIIYLEGNIGAGKTTLLRRLQKAYEQQDGLFLTEPVADWKWLTPFYANPRKYAKLLQVEIMQSFHKRETTCEAHDFYVLERSLNTSLNVFAAVNCTKSEIDELTELYKTLGYNNTFTPPARIVSLFVDTPVYVCYENIQKRNKSTDSSITIEYLTMLEKRHRKVFDHIINPNTFRIAGNRSMDEICRDAMDIINFLCDTTPVSGIQKRLTPPPLAKISNDDDDDNNEEVDI